METGKGTSKQAIAQHYDCGNRFWQLWLDRNMVYSGAMWQEGDDLEAAQIRKIDHHIHEAGAVGAKRVLEIGCGWGALLTRLANTYAVPDITGLTLSEAQLERVKGLNLPGVDARLENWQDHQPSAPYDAIISVGAFEHFARLEDDEARKVQNYREFFAKAQSMLVPNGRLSLQTFAYGSARQRSVAVQADSTRFLSEEIFRETDPPRLCNIAEAIEGHFEMVRMHNDREGYARTCKVWLDNLRAAKEPMIAEFGEEVYERYQRYLSYCFIGFKSGNMDLYRITLQRVATRR
jgi:cyclopropane-fatty-acyl-phospholipid synthase